VLQELDVSKDECYIVINNMASVNDIKVQSPASVCRLTRSRKGDANDATAWSAATGGSGNGVAWSCGNF
jgi:hypothetical protein